MRYGRFSRERTVFKNQMSKNSITSYVLSKKLSEYAPTSAIDPQAPGEGCKVNGYYIPMNYSKVLVNAYVVGRDPRYWINLEFSSERGLLNLQWNVR